LKPSVARPSKVPSIFCIFSSFIEFFPCLAISWMAKLIVHQFLL
jgi:hypothetical protein